MPFCNGDQGITWTGSLFPQGMGSLSFRVLGAIDPEQEEKNAREELKRRERERELHRNQPPDNGEDTGPMTGIPPTDDDK